MVVLADPITTCSSKASGSSPVMTGRSTPGRLWTRRPSIVVATISPASKSGIAAAGVGDGRGDGVGRGVGDGVGIGDAVAGGGGLGVSSGGMVQADSASARSGPIITRIVPTRSG
jgi:hypothetical protein